MISVFVDFHNRDTDGRVRLNTIGTMQDLNNQSVVLRDGLLIHLYSEDISLDGIVEYSPKENIWVAKLNPRRSNHF
jgi:hypothetical protein